MNNRVAIFLLTGLLGLFSMLPGCGRPQLIETDADPVSLAVDARGRYAYIACEGSKTLVSWDLKKRKSVQRVPVGTGPLRLYLDQDNRTLRLLCENERVMLIFSAPELKSAGRFPLPDRPSAMVNLSSSGKIIFASADTNFVRPYSGTNPLPAIEVSPNPVDLLAQPESDLLWIANDQASVLTLLNLENNAVVKRVPVWANPRRLLFAPQGGHLYALCVGKDVVPAKSVIQLVDIFYKSAGLKWTVGQDARDMVMGPRGRNIYVVDATQLSVLSARTGVQLLAVKTGKDPRALAVSPDGLKVYVACREDQAIFVHSFKSEQLQER